MITIGIISFNRLKYLKSLLTSLEVLNKEKFKICVVDNGSWESGLREFLTLQKDNNKIDQLFLRKTEERNWINDEYIAKNIIIENCKNDCIVFLQDDLQFIADDEYLTKICSDFMNMSYPCLEFNGVRRSTNNSKFFKRRSFVSKNSNLKYWISDDPHFQTMGIFKKEIFNEFGLYPTNWPKERQYWGRSEDYYDSLVKKKYSDINISSHYPAFLGVWNDPRGGYAFFRNDLRYAEYLDPIFPNETYYKQQNFDWIKSKQNVEYPLSFIDVATPLGWKIAISSDGDQAKYSQNQIIDTEIGKIIS
jgi:glycosyltransferase involved in cell wall biosynthesis